MLVKELLSGEEKWTQYWFAKTADGKQCGAKDERAVCWCLIGAVQHCYGGTGFHGEVHDKLRKALDADIVAWNDLPSRTFAEVRQLVEELNI